MSAKAKKAVEDALVVASRLAGAGHKREAEIIRRLCRSNGCYRTTLAQLWRDNMALRGNFSPPDEAEDSEPLPEPQGDFARRDPRVSTPFVRFKRRAPFHDDEPPSEPCRAWCTQCERQVTRAQASTCASPFCKAKASAA